MQIYYDLINMGLLIFSILLFASFSGLFSERAGIINIGIEGQMIISALIFSILSSFVFPNEPWAYFLALIITVICSIIFSLLHGLTCLKLKTNHLISGLAINALATGLAGFAIRSLKSGSTFIESKFDKLTITHTGILSSLNWYFVITIIVAIIVWLFFNKTSIGLRYASIGENPFALDAAGISVKKYQWSAIVISGAFSGVAGVFFLPLVSNFYYGSVYGFGFLALAVLIFGKWRVATIIGACFLFSIFTSTSYYNLDELSFIPKHIQSLLPYVISIITLIIFSKKPSVPKALGKPYDQSER